MIFYVQAKIMEGGVLLPLSLVQEVSYDGELERTMLMLFGLTRE